MPTPELILTRLLPASPAAVFRAWTDPDQLAAWGAPRELGMRVLELDLRPGGVCRYVMHAPTGQELWARFTYLEILAPERLVYTNAFADAAGQVIRSPGSPTWPLEVHNVLRFEPRGAHTELKLTSHPHRATPEEERTFAAARPHVEAGFVSSFDQLAAHLARHA